MMAARLPFSVYVCFHVMAHRHVRLGVVSLLAAGAWCQSGPWPTSPPFYPHTNRKTTVLNGTWAFGYHNTSVIDPVTVKYEELVTPSLTTVPGAFDVAPPGILGPRGVAVFRSSHACTPKVASLIKFYAVNFYARVFVDGIEAGNHTAGGYTPFAIQAPPCNSSGLREVVVVCANTQNATLSPTFTGGDFYFYSGIIRPVVVTELPTTAAFWIDSIEPISVDYHRGLIDIRVVFGGNYSSSTSMHLGYAFNGAPVTSSAPIPLVQGVAIIPQVAVPGVKLWTVGQGNLYTLQVTDTYLNDSVTVRSGLRVLGIDQVSCLACP